MLPLVEMFCRWELQEDCGNLRELMLRFDSEVELQTHALGRSLLGMIRDADNELEGLPRRPLVDPAPNPFNAVRDRLASVDTALRNLHVQVQRVDLIACRLDCPPRGCFEWPRHVQTLRIEISMHLQVLCVHNKYCKILSVSVTFISQFRLCMLHNASKHPGLETTALLLRLSLRLCFKLKCVSSTCIVFFLLLYAQCNAVCTSVMPKFHSPCNKAGTSREGTEIQSDSERDPASRCLQPLELPAADRDPPAAPAPAPSTGPVLSPESPAGVCSPLLLPSAAPNVPLRVASRGVANIPLHHTKRPLPMPFPNVNSTISTLLSCMDMCVLIISMYITSTETSEAHAAHRKKLKKKRLDDVSMSLSNTCERYESEDEETDFTHGKRIVDLLAWHIGVLNARWYVKPRSTCWFEEYLFNIYTPEMFYDILRMRRRTFERLVHDLRPFIQGQATHWRLPISVEKKVVVTLFKLMHGVPIPLVADRAALGKSTVHEILRQVCTAISSQFGHLIAWPVRRRLVRIADDFQAKQGFPNCIGAIDGSHIYVAAPSNTIVAADHRNRNKSFSILLQGVVDSKCFFTSINTGPPGSLHDSAHFKSSELYRKVEEGIMGGFHDDPLTWTSALPFPPYIVADRGYPLLSWCITPFKKGPLGLPLTREEAWFNRKHSSTRMSVERGFGILKARFKEIGTKSCLKLDFLPTVVHCCCVLHNILLASKDRTLDQILIECHLPAMDEDQPASREAHDMFHPPRPTGLVSEERALLEGQMAREDILDYLVRLQNAGHVGRHPRRQRN